MKKLKKYWWLVALVIIAAAVFMARRRAKLAPANPADSTGGKTAISAEQFAERVELAKAMITQDSGWLENVNGLVGASNRYSSLEEGVEGEARLWVEQNFYVAA